MTIYSRFDAKTGSFIGTRSTSVPRLTLDFGTSEIIVDGECDEGHRFDMDIGEVVEVAAERRLVKPDEVRRLAFRLLSDTDWQVTRQAETGQPIAPDVAAYRKAVRDHLDAMLTTDPIPLDYTDDRHWPPRP